MNPKGCYFHKNENIYGQPVKRTPEQYPYSFDQYCVYKSTDFDLTTDTVYSDRMWEWSPDKFNACHVRVWDELGQFFNCRKPKRVEEFLHAYFGISLDLTGIEAGCDFQNGNPYWVFYFKRNEPYKEGYLELNDEDRIALAREKELVKDGFRFFEQFH